ncbi:MAG: uroporphyrinogen-III synthase [Flavobacteriales bacterium]|nr:uroporphyrinogen-III synthase [Flavobacteriales bacterium]
MKGKKVLITRSAEDNKEFKEQLEKKGAIVSELPMINFKLIEDLTEIHKALDDLDNVDWIVFTSTKTVQFFFDIAEQKGVKFYYYPNLKIATVGEKTKLKLEQLGYRTNFVPIQYTAEVLAENMDENIVGKRILIPQSNLADREYLNVFEKRGAISIPITIYKNEAILYGYWDFEQKMNNELDYLTFTSGSSYKAFIANMNNAKIAFKNEKIICIGPSTAKVVEEISNKTVIIASPHTTDGIIKAIEKLEQNV